MSKITEWIEETEKYFKNEDGTYSSYSEKLQLTRICYGNYVQSKQTFSDAKNSGSEKRKYPHLFTI